MGKPPRTIAVFAGAFVGVALLSGLQNVLLNREGMQLTVEEMLDLELGSGAPAMYLILALRIAVAATIAWMVSVRASRMACGAAAIFVLARVWQGYRDWSGFTTGLAHNNPNSWFWASASALALVAAVSLFLPQSRMWIARKGRTIDDDTSVFG